MIRNRFWFSGCPLTPLAPPAPCDPKTRHRFCSVCAAVRSMLMSSFAHRVATGFLLLCPYAVAFVSSPNQQQQRLPLHAPQSSSSATTISATGVTPASSSARATELAATDRGAGGGSGVGGGAAGANGKPPRSVLERPWDVEVDFHGERRVITVQPGDSILEAVSTNTFRRLWHKK